MAAGSAPRGRRPALAARFLRKADTMEFVAILRSSSARPHTQLLCAQRQAWSVGRQPTIVHWIETGALRATTAADV